MRKCVLVVMALLSGLLLLSCARASRVGEVRHLEMPSSLPETVPQIKISVYLPPGYERSLARFPVLYLLPGMYGDSLTFFGRGYGPAGLMKGADAATVVDRLLQGKKVQPLIVVSPDISAAGAPAEEFMRDVVSFIDSEFRTLSRRESRAIAGHSAGGFQAVRAGFHNMDLFTVVGGLSTNGLIMLRASSLLADHDQAARPVRVWLYAGTSDPERQASSNKDFAAALERNGVPATYVEDDGDHISKVPQRLGEFIEFASRHFTRPE